jgi:hypothetical protein
VASIDQQLPPGPDWIGRKFADLDRTIRELRFAGGGGGTGPTGPAGPPGGSYVHTQAVPAATWTVVHGLGMFPNVTAVDSAGTAVVGQETWLDANTIQLDFSAAFAGEAYVS